MEGDEILRTARRAHSKLTALDLRADFGLFKALLSVVQWEIAWEGRGNARGRPRMLAGIQGSLPPSSDASRQGGNRAKMPAGLHGWIRSC